MKFFWDHLNLTKNSVCNLPFNRVIFITVSIARQLLPISWGVAAYPTWKLAWSGSRPFPLREPWRDSFALGSSSRSRWRVRLCCGDRSVHGLSLWLRHRWALACCSPSRLARMCCLTRRSGSWPFRWPAVHQMPCQPPVADTAARWNMWRTSCISCRLRWESLADLRRLLAW